MNTLNDLKRNGLILTRIEAQELNPLINNVAQHGEGDVIIFAGSKTVETETLPTVSKEEYDALQSEYEALKVKHSELETQLNEILNKEN